MALLKAWFQNTDNTNRLEAQFNKMNVEFEKQIAQENPKPDSKLFPSGDKPEERKELNAPVLLIELPPKDFNLNHIKNIDEDTGEDLAVNQLNSQSQSVAAGSPISIIAPDLFSLQGGFIWYKPLNQDYAKHGMDELTHYWKFLKETEVANTKFNNTASYLLKLIRQQPQGNKCLKDFLFKLNNPDVEGYIQFLTDQTETSFHIKKISNPEFERLVPSNMLNEFPLIRLHVAQHIVSCIVYRVFKRCVRHVSYKNKIRSRKDFKTKNSNENWNFKSNAWSFVPHEKAKDETINFLKEHMIFVDQNKFQSNYYGSLEENQDWKETWQNNTENLLHFDVMNEFCQASSGNKPLFYEYGSKGGIQGDKGEWKQYNPYTGKLDGNEAMKITHISENFGSIKKSQPDTSFFLQKMNVSFYPEKLTSNNENKLHHISTFFPKLNRNWKIHNIIRSDNQPTQIENGAYHATIDLLERSKTGTEFNWHVVNEYFENDNFYFSTPMMFLQNFQPDDEWSLYFHWNAAIGNTFQVSLFVLAQYFYFESKRNISKDVKTLSAKIQQNSVYKQVIDQYLNKKV